MLNNKVFFPPLCENFIFQGRKVFSVNQCHRCYAYYSRKNFLPLKALWVYIPKFKSVLEKACQGC